jgi:hypothetical protein
MSNIPYEQLSEQYWVDALGAILWKTNHNTPICPYCKGACKTYALAEPGTYYCSNRKVQFTIRTGTIFANSKVSIRVLFEVANYVIHQSKMTVGRWAKQNKVAAPTAMRLIRQAEKAVLKVKDGQLLRDMAAVYTSLHSNEAVCVDQQAAEHTEKWELKIYSIPIICYRTATDQIFVDKNSCRLLFSDWPTVESKHSGHTTKIDHNGTLVICFNAYRLGNICKEEQLKGSQKIIHFLTKTSQSLKHSLLQMIKDKECAPILKYWKDSWYEFITLNPEDYNSRVGLGNHQVEEFYIEYIRLFRKNVDVAQRYESADDPILALALRIQLAHFFDDYFPDRYTNDLDCKIKMGSLLALLRAANSKEEFEKLHTTSEGRRRFAEKSRRPYN